MKLQLFSIHINVFYLFNNFYLKKGVLMRIKHHVLMLIPNNLGNWNVLPDASMFWNTGKESFHAVLGHPVK